jgi:lipoate-protein ligase B
VNPQFLKLLNSSEFGLDPAELSWLDERTLVVKKWNWDYAQAHAFQLQAVRLLQDFQRNRVLVCCNHPHVFTNGRGLQKSRKGETLELKEFNVSDYPSLPFPLHQIERGGGLTFHHPGQFVLYPIVKLNPAALSLSRMIDEIFAFSSKILTNWGMQNISSENKLLGLWVNERKVASMGIAIEKLTTYHGMALNLIHDQKMGEALRVLNPCGLSSNTYTSVDQFVALPSDALEKFTASFLKEVQNAW